MSTSTTAATGTPHRLGRGLVALLAVATGVAVANNYYAQPLLAAMRDDLGISAALAGTVVTVAQVGYAAGLVLLLPVGDLLERRRLVSAMSGVCALALVLAAVAPGVGVLLFALLAVGAASVVAQVLVPLAATLAGEAERGRVVGNVMSGLLLGILLARTVAGYIGQAAGWRTVYWVAAGLMSALAVVLRLRLPETRPPATGGYGRLLASTVALARDEPVLRLRSLYGALSFGAFSVLWTSLAFLLAGPPFRFGEGTIGLFGLAGAAGAAMASVAGRLADRGRTRLVTMLTALGLALAYLPLWLGGHSLAWLVVGLLVLDLAAQGLHITNQSEIYRLRPDARNRVNAVYMVTYFVGGAAGSAGSAVAFGRAGWAGVCTVGAAFGVAAVVVHLVAATRTRRPAAQPYGVEAVRGVDERGPAEVSPPRGG